MDMRFFITDVNGTVVDNYFPEQNPPIVPRLDEKIWISGRGTMKVVEILHQEPLDSLPHWVIMISLQPIS